MWPTSFWLYQAGRSGGELILSKLTFLLILVRFVQSKHLGQLTLSAIEVKLNSFSAHLSTGKFCSGSGTCLPLRPMRRAWFLRLVTSHSPAQAGGHYGHCRQLPPASCPELGAFKPPKKAKSLHPEVMRCHIRLCTDLPGPSWNGKIQNGSIWTSSVGAPITVSFLHRWLLPDSLSKTVLKGPEGWKSARKKWETGIQAQLEPSTSKLCFQIRWTLSWEPHWNEFSSSFPATDRPMVVYPRQEQPNLCRFCFASRAPCSLQMPYRINLWSARTQTDAILCDVCTTQAPGIVDSCHKNPAKLGSWRPFI